MDGSHWTAIAETARQWRVEAGLTQQQLARQIGSTQSAISRLERGNAVPDLSTLARIASACGGSLMIGRQHLDAVERRQLHDSLALTPAQRAQRNRRQTTLAARAATAARRPVQP